MELQSRRMGKSEIRKNSLGAWIIANPGKPFGIWIEGKMHYYHSLEPKKDIFIGIDEFEEIFGVQSEFNNQPEE